MELSRQTGRALRTGKAVGARALFVLHSTLAVSRTAAVLADPSYYCLTAPLFLILAEGVMNIWFREAQETVGFCPCVFVYLLCAVPPIWLMEAELSGRALLPAAAGEPESALDLQSLLGLASVDQGKGAAPLARLYTTVLEQLLLVVLVLGRWLLPKGDLSRSQLSQLLLVYVGTAADIAELLETFKEPHVCLALPPKQLDQKEGIAVFN